MTTISNVMATSIKLEGTAAAAQSLKSLTNAVKTATSSWKAQEAQLKSSGDKIGAVQAKYDGLGNAMIKLQDKIALLKERQASLDTTTEQGKNAFDKYTDQLNKAERQYASLSAQEERTGKSLDYYKSGLAGLQSSYRAISSSSQAYVDRLEAEGKTQEANREKVKTYQDSIKNLTEQLKIQESELSKIDTSTTKGADAYRLQKQRVDETATALAKTKTQMSDLDDTMKKANPSFFDKLKAKLTGTNNEAKDTSKSISDIVKGSAIGSAIGNGISNLASSLGDAAKQGFQLDVAGDELKKRWSDLSLPTKAVNGLMNQIGEIRGKSNESGTAINTLQTKIYSLTSGSVPKTKALTNELFAFGKQAGMTGDQIDGMGSKLTRLFSTQKVNLSTFNKTFSGMPALKQAIVEASGMTSEAFNKALSTGKITGQQLQDLMVKASSQSGKAWEQFGDTSAGKIAKVQGSWTNMKAQFMKPITTSALDGMNRVMSSLVNKKGGLTSVGKSINSLVGGLSKTVGHGITDVINFLVKNKGSISDIVGSVTTIVKELAEGAWKTFSGLLSDIGGHSKSAKSGLKGVASGLKAIAKHKDAVKAVGAVLLTAFAANKIKAVASGFSPLTGALKKTGKWLTMKDADTGISRIARFGGKLKDLGSTIGGTVLSAVKKFSGVFLDMGKFMLTNPIGITITAIGLLAIAFVELYKHCKPFRDFVNKIGKEISKAFSGVGKTLSKVGKWFSSTFNDIIKFFKKNWKDIALLIANPIAGGLKLAYKNIKPFRDFVNGLAKALKSAFSTMTKTISGWGTNISKWLSSFGKSFSKAWSSTWKTVGKNLSSSWKGMTKTISGWGTNIGKWHDEFHKGFHKVWSAGWKTTQKTLSTAWTDMTTTTSKWGSTMSGWLSDFGKTFSKGWKSMWRGIESFLSNIWKNIKSGVKSGFNGVIGIINDVIGAINSVWKFFTGHKALGKLAKLANGGVITAEQRLVMVNDDGTANPKELIQLPNGVMGMFQGRDVKAMLPVGTRVYNSKETKNIMTSAGIERYANGGWIGSAFNSVKSFIGGTWDKAKAIAEWAAHPIKHVESMITKSISGASAGIKSFTTFATDTVKKLTSSIVKWFKNKLNALNDSLNGGSPNGGNINLATLRKAANIENVNPSDKFLKELAAVMMSESGGKADASNNWDVNAGANHSVGVLQYTLQTWNAFARKGYANRKSILDNAVTFFNNSDWKNSIGYVTYPSWGGHYKWDWKNNGPIGHRRYANGGIITQEQLALLGEGNKAETVIPWDLSKRSKAYELMDETMRQFKKDDKAANTPSTSTEDNSLMINLLSQVVSLLQNDKQKQVVISVDGQDIANILAPYTAKAQTTYTNHQTRLTKGVRQNGSIAG